MDRLTFAFRTFALVGIMTLSAVSSRGDFPDPAKLPERAELPDPLTMFDGTRVTTKEQWRDQRRPELKKLFEHYMYGTFPAPAAVKGKVERTDKEALGGKATLKEITLTLGDGKAPKLHVLLLVPNKRTKPAPVFVGMNFRGNHTVLKDPAIHIPESWMRGEAPAVKNDRATEAGRGTEVDTWALEQTIDRGYAVATLYYGDAVPDDPKHRDEGIQPHFKAPGADADSEWGAVAAWAWALQRVVDYLATDADIDMARIIVVGHSRLGKATLLAAAFDERFALVIPHQAGCGGTAPSRGKVGESVKQINERFPHWFDGNFKKFNDDPQRLPFDQHCLVALCAPRPVLFSNAVEDQWANPDGQFEMLKAATPVYRLLGVEGLEAKQMPEEGKLIDSRLGYFLRAGKHSMTRQDWRAYLDFADRHLGAPAVR